MRCFKFATFTIITAIAATFSSAADPVCRSEGSPWTEIGEGKCAPIIGDIVEKQGACSDGRYGNSFRKAWSKKLKKVIPKWHKGVDIKGTSSTSVYSAAEGEIYIVRKSASLSKSGISISIRHVDGSISRYWHLSSLSHLDDISHSVKKGELLGYVGDTGNASNCPHLHFEVREKAATRADNGGKAFSEVHIDPIEWMSERMPES